MLPGFLPKSQLCILGRIYDWSGHAFYFNATQLTGRSMIRAPIAAEGNHPWQAPNVPLAQEIGIDV